MKRKIQGGKIPHKNRYKQIQETLNNSLINYNRIQVDTKKIISRDYRYTFIDLFSGAGGLSCGFEMANYGLAYSAEIDPDAIKTLKRNFPHAHHFEGPIQNINDNIVSEIAQKKLIHVVCGGFPCQGFSPAGKRDPNDSRNVLYKEVLRFVRVIKPWFVVMENVPGIITMQEGSVFKSIIEDFSKIGYPEMSVLVLESASFGVPQFRPRAIFITNRFGVRNPFPKPILTPEEYVPIEQAIDDLKNLPPSPAINHEWTAHSKEMEQRISKVEPGYSLYDSYYDAWKRQYPGIPCMTIKENHGGTHIHPSLNRVLSAREMARLQSFPDSFIFEGRMKRVMWQVGNAVPPLLAMHVALALRPTLDQIRKTFMGR